MTTIDTTTQTRIFKSYRDALISVALASLIVAVSVWGISQDGNGYYDSRARTGGWLGVIVFGPLLIWWLGVLIRPHLAPVTLDPEGITDIRVNRAQIPWDQVSNVAKRGSVVSLTLRRKYARTFHQSLQARLAKKYIRKGGPSHVYILPTGLGTTRDALHKLIEAYWRAKVPA